MNNLLYNINFNMFVRSYAVRSCRKAIVGGRKAIVGAKPAGHGLKTVGKRIPTKRVPATLWAPQSPPSIQETGLSPSLSLLPKQHHKFAPSSSAGPVARKSLKTDKTEPNKKQAIQTSGNGIILSIDLGEKNFAFCLVDKQTFTVLHWQQLNLEKEGVKTSNIESVYEFFQKFLMVGPVLDAVAETHNQRFQRLNQRIRNSSRGRLFLQSPAVPTAAATAGAAPFSSSVAPSTSFLPLFGPSSVVLIENQVGARLRAMQAVAFAVFRSLACPTTMIAYPRKVHAHFGIGGSGSSWKANKRASVHQCASLLLQSEQPAANKHWFQFFQAADKQDDLADCYLQARWYYEDSINNKK